jgi:putative salt-induced outer membrane protein YdiY
LVIFALFFSLPCPAQNEAEAAGSLEDQEEAVVTAPDTVYLKDGSVIKGHIVEMGAGKLKLNLTSEDEIVISWSEVQAIESEKSIVLQLKDDSVQKGTLGRGDDGQLIISRESVAEPIVVDVASVAAVNPPPVKYIRHKGNLNAGGVIDDGNTDKKEFSAFGEYIARSKEQRLTIKGEYHYSEENGNLSERNGKAGIKYDLFLTDRFFIFASAQIEKDEFEDLRLRTALTTGPGYQFIDDGDFESEYLDKMELYAQVGIAFFSEDYEDADDDQYAAGHWGIRWDWPITPLGMTVFHNHLGFPGLENGDDIYVTSQQGIRFDLWQGLIATLQVNWDWDNTPQPGNDRSDTKYLGTVGYAFDF